MRSLANIGKELSPRGRTLRELELNLSQIGLAESRSLLREDIFRRAFPCLENGDRRRDTVTAESLGEYQKFVRDSFLESIGGLPDSTAPLNARTVRTHDMGGFILENVIFESRPHSYVTANLYRPKNLSGKVPAVLVPLGHTDEGKAFDEYQRVAQMLVYAGFIALTFDPIGEGERFEHYEKEIAFEPIQGCSGEHDLLDWKCKLTGESLIKYFVHDGMRAIEYLLSRPDVSEVAVTGHSGGGTQTSALMTAASHLLSAAAPCSYTTDKRAMYETAKDPDNEMIWQGLAAKGIDYADIMAGMAPKPVMILSNSYDFFPREGTERTFEKIKRLWANVGAETAPELVRVDSAHSFTEELAKAVTRFFSKNLLGHDADLTGFEYRRLEPDILNCTQTGQIVEEFSDLVTTHDLLVKREKELKNARLAQPYEIRRENAVKWLREKVYRGRKPQSVNVRVDDEGVMAHYIYRRLVWKPEEGYFENGVLIKDMRHGDDTPLPTVIALWEDGTEAIERHSLWLHRQCAAGRQVLIVDLVGTGSCAPNRLSGQFMDIGWSTNYILNAELMDLGDCYAALRTYHAVSALGVVPDLPLPYDGTIIFYGEGEYARYAKIAALLTGTAVIDNRDYQTYGEIVREKYHDQTHTSDWIFPGILEFTDMDEIDVYLKDNNLLM